METQNYRVTLDQHWAASASGDLEAEHRIYHDNVLCEYPQSGEKIHGRVNLQALRGHHPGKPSGFVIRRIVGINDLWITEYVINYKTAVVQTISIMEFQNGKVIHETQYFAEPFEAPAWRSQWVEKRQIVRGISCELVIGGLMDHYDAIVIGSGQAGTPLCVALAAAGRKTTLVESQHVGGTWYQCRLHSDEGLWSPARESLTWPGAPPTMAFAAVL